MALTVTRPVSGSDGVWGNKRVKVREILFDSSYPTGGESLTAADVGLKTIEQVLPHGPASNSDGTGGNLGVPVRYDHSTSKLQAFESAGDGDSLDEVGSTNSLANYLVRITFIGT
jgi:hypothetical protein